MNTSGLEDSDKATRDAVVKFSFYLSIGNTEEAFKSIKMIKNQASLKKQHRFMLKTLSRI